MHFWQKLGKDPGNLETVRESYGSKEIGAIAVHGTDDRKMASMDTFRTPYIMVRINVRHALDGGSIPPWDIFVSFCAVCVVLYSSSIIQILFQFSRNFHSIPIVGFSGKILPFKHFIEHFFHLSNIHHSFGQKHDRTKQWNWMWIKENCKYSEIHENEMICERQETKQNRTEAWMMLGNEMRM
jgi:hypothetical protein